MTAVTNIPRRIPRTGFLKMVKSLIKFSLYCRPLKESLIVFMPYIRTEKPRRVEAMACLRSFFVVKSRMIPNKAKIGVKFSGWKNFTMKLSPLRPDKDKIQAVMVVPMLAPMMTGTAWVSWTTPELTKATTMTVTADEDWITAVTPVPKTTALNFDEVKRVNNCSRRPLERLAKPSPKICIPNRNRHKPPIKRNIS